jgi:hypothetical protein
MLPEYIDRESCDSYLVILIVKGGGARRIDEFIRFKNVYSWITSDLKMSIVILSGSSYYINEVEFITPRHLMPKRRIVIVRHRYTCP